MKKLLAFALVFIFTININTFALEFNSEDENIKIKKLAKLKLVELIGKEEMNSKKVSRGPAKPLSYLETLAVCSSTHPSYEIIESNEFRTINDHDGIIRVVTVEVGHSLISSRKAKIYTNEMECIYSEPLYIDNDNEVDGWYVYWQIDNSDGGKFTYKADSLNWPWTEMEDSLYIK